MRHFGRVYKVVNVSTGDFLAGKEVLQPNWEREVQTLSKLASSNRFEHKMDGYFPWSKCCRGSSSRIPTAYVKHVQWECQPDVFRSLPRSLVSFSYVLKYRIDVCKVF